MACPVVRPCSRISSEPLPRTADLACAGARRESARRGGRGRERFPACCSPRSRRTSAAPLAIVVPDEKAAERILRRSRGGRADRVFHAPAPTLTPYQRIPPSLKARRDEFALLSALAEPGAVQAAVLPARSLFTRLPSPEDLARLRSTLHAGRRSRSHAFSPA